MSFGTAFGTGGSQTLVQTLDRVAREAAELIRQVYRTPFSVDFKGPSDPVTEADRLANQLICERLAALFPNVPIVAEESEPLSFAGYQSAERIFFVDPLDVDFSPTPDQHCGFFATQVSEMER